MTSEMADKYALMSLIEVIGEMNVMDLIWLYLDNGSWHKKKHFMHLYTNSLNLTENEALIKRIEELIGIKCKLRIDRKKDGRQYYYLALSVSDSLIMKNIVRDYIRSYPELSCFNYKVGIYE